MTTFVFLSNEWIVAAEAIHAEFIDHFDAPEQLVRINVIVTEAPFGEGTIRGHIDTTNGNTRPQHGHVDDPEATVTLAYEIARSLFVTQDFDTVVTAFMMGRIDVQGDITRLLFLQNLEPTPAQVELGRTIGIRLSAITAE